MWREILKAARYAKNAHAGQLRKHGVSYFEHPRAVARRLWNAQFRCSEVIQAAYLHDVVEDCGILGGTIEEKFGKEVARLVNAVTKRKGETEDQFYWRVRGCGLKAMVIKSADRDHNNSELHFLPKDHPTVYKAGVKTLLMQKIFK